MARGNPWKKKPKQAPPPKPTGEQLRDEEMEKALDGQAMFVLNVSNYVVRNMKGMEITGEDIRLKCQSMWTPRHHNSWGAVTGSLAKRGAIIDTGRIRKCKDPRGHARRLPIWLVI